MINLTTRKTPLIDSATSDDGRIRYSPIGNDALSIDGRGIYQGHWLNARGMMADRVPADIFAPAIALMREVDAHNRRAHDEMRDADFARQDARDEAFARTMSRVPKHLNAYDL